MQREWKTGDRLYRFAFDPSQPKGYLDVFELTDVQPEGKTAKYKSVKNAHATLGASACYVQLSVVNRVYYSGRARFVVLGENDYWKARKLLAEAIARRRREHETALSRLNEFENWLSGQGEDDLE